LWKPPVKILTPKLDGFSSFEIDSSTTGELIYNMFLLNKREQIRPVLSVEPLHYVWGTDNDATVRYPCTRCKRALCVQTTIFFFVLSYKNLDQ